ncbi:hypothetical protein CsSME_00014174 [Camellia sinensis var. sinensis]
MVNFFIGFQVPLDLDPFAFVIDGLAFIADQLASHIPVGVFYKFGTILSCKVAEENVKSKVLGLFSLIQRIHPWL